MRTSLTILGIAGGVVLLVLVAVAIAVWTVDPNQFVGPVLARVKSATGRDVSVGGGVEFNLGLAPRLVVNDVRIGNAPWAKGADLLVAKRVEAQVALLPLLQRRFELVRLHVVEPVIALEKNERGDGNWELGATPGTAGAPGAESTPGTLGIADLAISGGQLTYRDGATGSETRVAIDELSLRARDAQSPVNAQFRGTIDGVAVALTGNLGPLATLAQRRLPYPIALQGEIGGRKTSAAVKVRRADGLVELQDLEVASGSSNVKGRVEIRNGGAQSTVTVNLASPSLAVDDLPLPGATAAAPKRTAGAGASASRVFADDAFAFDALRKNNANGEVTIDRLVLRGGRVLDRIRVEFALRDGKLDVPLLQAGALGGTLSGALKIDATRGTTPAIDLRVDGHGLDLAALLAAAGVNREVRGGKSELAIDVKMRGVSPRQWASSMNGRAQVVVGPATLVGAKRDPSLSFDRLAEAVNPFGGATASTELRCAVIRLPLRNGVAEVDRAIALETVQLEASASGTLDFRNETLDLAIRPRIRQGIPIEIPQIAELVRFRGPFTAPTVGIDAVASAATIARIGAAVGTGGWSILGEALLASVGSSGGACAVALGKAQGATSTSGAAAKGGTPAKPIEDLGKALERLFKR